MTGKGIKPTAHTYVTTSAANQKVGNLNRCIELVNEAMAAGIDLNSPASRQERKRINKSKEPKVMK